MVPVRGCWTLRPRGDVKTPCATVPDAPQSGHGSPRPSCGNDNLELVERLEGRAGSSAVPAVSNNRIEARSRGDPDPGQTRSSALTHDSQRSRTSPRRGSRRKERSLKTATADQQHEIRKLDSLRPDHLRDDKYRVSSTAARHRFRKREHPRDPNHRRQGRRGDRRDGPSRTQGCREDCPPWSR
jgi:hypothetical protein